MTTRLPEIQAPGTPTDRELLAQLGLGPGASNAEIEEAHDEIVAFLESASGALRPWARQRISEADEAYAILRGEASGDQGPIAAAPAVLLTPEPRERPRPARPTADEDRDWLDEDVSEPEPDTARTRRGRRDAQRAASVQPNRLGAMPAAADGRRRLLRRSLLGSAAIVVVAVGAFAIYQLGSPTLPPISGSPNPNASAAAGVDQAQVAALMQKLVANPNDLTALQDLADVYYAGGDYATARTWLAKILAIDPKNVAALLGSGAADYNVDDLAGAEVAWRAVLAVDPKNVEAHYDLGFMYLSENKTDQVIAEWNQVIALAPNTDIAKTVATHLASLTGSPAPSTGPSPS